MFQTLRLHLLLSYLAVMVATMSLSAAATYLFFAHSLYKQFDNEVINLAKAAEPGLALAKQKISDPFDQNPPLPRPFVHHECLEWFDANRSLLARVGTSCPTLRLSNKFNVLEQQRQIRSFILPVYRDDRNWPRSHLEGYIRASDSVEEVEAVLTKLRWGTSLFGLVVLSLTAIGGMWLTRIALGPVESSFRQLQQFTADASHELRIPLTVVKSYVELMQSHPERIHPLDLCKLVMLASATEQMTHLVEELLFLTRTEAIKTNTVACLPIPLDELLQDLVEFLEPEVEAKQITLTFQSLSGISVSGDAMQLTRLFTNLLKNALQYTPSGGSVELSMSRLERTVIVSIKDTGVGIAKQDLSKVFNRFWRADKARSQQQGGTGLGLAIAKVIAQNHGGEITVSSRLGVGSCFRVHLPLLL